MINYYILRDRLPVWLLLIWTYRSRIRELAGFDILHYFGYYLITVTNLTIMSCLGLLLLGGKLDSLVFFRWSFPSPIQWGLLIMVLTHRLHDREVPLFEAYIISLLTALGGGWLWEILHGIPYWIESGFAYWNWYKFNQWKVFLFEFQIFCLPIVSLILRENYRFDKERLETIWLIPFVIVFYLCGRAISPFFHQLGSIGGNTLWSWVMRLPALGLLYYWIDGVRND